MNTHGTMQDARLVETEVVVPKPKRFVRETLVMPDGYQCDWYYVDTPPSVMVIPVTPDRRARPGPPVPAQPEELQPGVPGRDCQRRRGA